MYLVENLPSGEILSEYNRSLFHIVHPATHPSVLPLTFISTPHLYLPLPTPPQGSLFLRGEGALFVAIGTVSYA